MNKLAIEGGTPVRRRLLPYSHQSIQPQDIKAVTDALTSDWLTTGPKVRQFELAFAGFTGAAEAVAVNSGTAALHAAVNALGIGSGDEVIVPVLTFAASANCVVYQGATPVFADIDSETLLIDPADVERKITRKTKAIIAVDYAGQPCDYDELRCLARDHGLALIADACHSLGARYCDTPVGQLADVSVFSFHPVKAMTTAEGGMITTASAETAQHMRRFRNHGIDSDHFTRAAQGSWLYEMVELGYNYRLSDLQCALGRSQLARLPEWLARRRAIAERYDTSFSGLAGMHIPRVRPNRQHAYHLYVIRLDYRYLSAGRREIFAALRAENIGVNVHYLPVHCHPYYRQRFGTRFGMCPRAEGAYEELLSLPLFPAMEDEDVEDVIEALWKVITRYSTGYSDASTRKEGTSTPPER